MSLRKSEFEWVREESAWNLYARGGLAGSVEKDDNKDYRCDIRDFNTWSNEFKWKYIGTLYTLATAKRRVEEAVLAG